MDTTKFAESGTNSLASANFPINRQPTQCGTRVRPSAPTDLRTPYTIENAIYLLSIIPPVSNWFHCPCVILIHFSFPRWPGMVYCNPSRPLNPYFYLSAADLQTSELFSLFPSPANSGSSLVIVDLNRVSPLIEHAAVV